MHACVTTAASATSQLVVFVLLLVLLGTCTDTFVTTTHAMPSCSSMRAGASKRAREELCRRAAFVRMLVYQSMGACAMFSYIEHLEYVIEGALCVDAVLRCGTMLFVCWATRACAYFFTR